MSGVWPCDVIARPSFYLTKRFGTLGRPYQCSCAMRRLHDRLSKSDHLPFAVGRNRLWVAAKTGLGHRPSAISSLPWHRLHSCCRPGSFSWHRSNITTAPPNRAGRNAPPSLARPVNEPARRAYPNLQVIDETGLVVAPFPQAALFLAGKALTPYSRAGGSAGCLTDFFVGAHAAVH